MTCLNVFNSYYFIVCSSYSSYRFFGSRYDTLSNLMGDNSELTPSSPVVTHLTQLASSLAQTLLEVSGSTYRDDSSPPNATASPETVAGLLECFLVQSNCSLLRTVLGPDWLDILRKKEAALNILYMYIFT